MKYIDLHCDALTTEGVSVVDGRSLAAGGCMLQCFAAFVDGGKGEGTARALSLCDKFDSLCKAENYRAVKGAEDLSSDRICALLTVEGGEAVEGSLEKLAILHARGVRMMTLTWNHLNAIGAPNGERGGLTPFGRACVARMCELKMLADISHGSDALARETAEICRSFGMPAVASHSNARAVLSHPRNLPDETIRLIAESGGTVGLCFAMHFLSADGKEEGQREAMLAHAKHIVDVGGEDALSLGTDFDGTPKNSHIHGPADMPKLLFDLEKTFGGRIAEKIAFRNALRLLRSL